jgi:hypothetical protein
MGLLGSLPHALSGTQASVLRFQSPLVLRELSDQLMDMEKVRAKDQSGRT